MSQIQVNVKTLYVLWISFTFHFFRFSNYTGVTVSDTETPFGDSLSEQILS